MRAKLVVPVLTLVLCAVAFPPASQAETLSWHAVTTYTDGSAIGSAVTYTAIWSTSPSLTSPAVLASSTSSTSAVFNVTTASMPRGSTIYVAVRATVGGVSSAYSTPLSWLVPSLAPRTPDNLRVQ